jgi:hypothetical protein
MPSSCLVCYRCQFLVISSFSRCGNFYNTVKSKYLQLILPVMILLFIYRQSHSMAYVNTKYHKIVSGKEYCFFLTEFSNFFPVIYFIANY